MMRRTRVKKKSKEGEAAICFLGVCTTRRAHFKKGARAKTKKTTATKRAHTHTCECTLVIFGMCPVYTHTKQKKTHLRQKKRAVFSHRAEAREYRRAAAATCVLCVIYNM